eukprot:gene4468-5062_t
MTAGIRLRKIHKLEALTATMENLTLELKGKSKGNSKDLGPLLPVGSEQKFRRSIAYYPYSNLTKEKEALATEVKALEDNYTKLVEGHNQYWYNMKNHIKAHLLCSGELSQLHFDALKWEEKQEVIDVGERSEWVNSLSGRTLLRSLLLVDVSVKAWNLQAPVWKILIWQRKVIDEFERMRKFSGENLTTKMVNLTAHVNEIKDMSYKGCRLVQGWLMEGQSVTGEEEEPVIDWIAREIQDCEEDLQLFACDLLNSLKSHLANVSRMQSQLRSMDLDTIIGHMTGDRNDKGCVKIDEAALEHYSHDEFKELFAYVCYQDHLQALALSKDMITDPSLSHVIHRKLKVFLKELVWHPKYIDVLVDCLKVVKEDGMAVLLRKYLNEECEIMEGSVVEKINRVEAFER